MAPASVRRCSTPRSSLPPRLAQEHWVELIAIGNGTASREIDRLGAELIRLK
jgi:transcriptional accessory protein Tex/SPT6